MLFCALSTGGAPLALPYRAALAALALAAAVRADGPATCSQVRSIYAPTPPWDNQLIDPSLQGEAWTGAFNSVRSNGQTYTGTVVNYITDLFMYQTATVIMSGVLLPAVLTYCPLNITRVPNVRLTGSTTGTRFDIWWVLSAVPDPTIRRVQCLSLAIIGGGVEMSWQTIDGLCPSSTWPPLPGVTNATYVNRPTSGARGRGALAVAAVAAAGAVAAALL
jgi:hypothetical protein